MYSEAALWFLKQMLLSDTTVRKLFVLLDRKPILLYETVSFTSAFIAVLQLVKQDVISPHLEMTKCIYCRSSFTEPNCIFMELCCTYTFTLI